MQVESITHWVTTLNVFVNNKHRKWNSFTKRQWERDQNWPDSSLLLNVANEISIRESIQNEKIITGAKLAILDSNQNWPQAFKGVIVQLEMRQGLSSVNSLVFTSLCIMGFLRQCWWQQGELWSLFYLTLSIIFFPINFSPIIFFLNFIIHYSFFARFASKFSLCSHFFKKPFLSRWVTNWRTFPIKFPSFICLLLLQTSEFVLACCSRIVLNFLPNADTHTSVIVRKYNSTDCRCGSVVAPPPNPGWV